MSSPISTTNLLRRCFRGHARVELRLKRGVEDEGEVDALMARLADGDRLAFTPAFRQLWPPVLRLCTSLLKDDADAADAAQQAMEKILARAADYDPQRRAMPWVLAIASWECRTILRKRARRRETPEAVLEDASQETPEDDFARRQLVEAAVHALGALSDQDREILLATFWDEAALGQGATQRKRRERALTRLRKAWRRLYGLE